MPRVVRLLLSLAALYTVSSGKRVMCRTGWMGEIWRHPRHRVGCPLGADGQHASGGGFVEPGRAVGEGLVMVGWALKRTAKYSLLAAPVKAPTGFPSSPLQFDLLHFPGRR
ncbi:hypothetical protein Taro_028803 [Colocasia esculenta]|uniref:Secreted protein n=1 Tax=Colocasia esculenta TaxID=4460 RepID=A0A843VSZ9_COLES|nr:hypothetical protein [Colocasia esculenta]